MLNKRDPFHPHRILFLCLFLTTAYSTACNLGCSNEQGAKQLLKYVPGQVYEYGLESVLSIGVYNGSTTQEQLEEDTINSNKLRITADAKLYAQENCVYTLQLNDLKISSSVEGVAKKQLQHLEQPIQFSMQANGHVGSEICIPAAEAENHYVLNVKRAIISLVQTQLSENDGDYQQEIDIYGNCATRTLQRGNTVVKLRNLNTCKQREHIQSALLSGAGVTNQATSGPYLQADYHKETQLNGNGIVEKVQLTEIYRHAGRAAAGAEASARMRTVLKLSKPGVAAAAPTINADAQSVSLIFSAVGVTEGLAKNIQALRAALNELLPHLQGQVQVEAAKEFVELIRLMRSADYDSLLELGNIPQSPQKSLAYKAYLDALFRVGTSASSRVITKILPKLQKKEQFLAIASLYLVQHVDRDALKAATTLINPTTQAQLFLPIGNLLKKYCDTNSAESCATAIEDVARPFGQQLKQCKTTNSQEEERVIAILKGVSNMQHVNAALTQALYQCLTTERAATQRVRVAALQTIAAAASCEQNLQQRALELLADAQEDSELRIEAYLTAVQCANPQVANKINEVLQKEASQQVNGFINTHLRVLRDSTDTARAQQRDQLATLFDSLTQNIPLNWRRFSANQEFSYKLPALGLSASTDLKLLYSQQAGFLPRSARLNFTSEIFGHNFNVLDINVRQENIERLLEYYLGPKGLLNKDFEEIAKTMGGHPRARRSLLTDAQKVAKKYKNYGESKQNAQSTHLNLDISLKLFGSELSFLTLGDNIPQNIEDLLSLFGNAMEMSKNKLKQFSHEFQLHTLFLDSELVYPTSMGVPLTMSAQGFAASKFDVAAEVDLDAVLSDNWSAAKYRLKFVPSVAAEIQLRLGFITPYISSGVRVYSTLHTATGSDLAMTFTNNGKGFQTQIQLPRAQLDLINVQTGSDFYVSEVDKPKTKSLPLSEALTGNAATSTLCFNQLEESTGFDFCIDTNQIGDNWAESEGKSNAALSLLRPFSLHLYVRAPKQINLSAEQVETDNARSWSFKYATPGTAESHDTALALTLANKPNKHARFSLENPKLQFAAELGLNSDAKELVLYAQFEHNSEKTRSKIGFNKIAENEYEPIVELQNHRGEVMHDIAGYKLSGRLRVEEHPKRKYTFDKFALTQVGNAEQLLQFNGWTQVEGTAVSSELHLTAADKHIYFIETKLGMNQGSYDVAFFINDEQTPQNVHGVSVHAKIVPQQVVIDLVGKARAWEISLSSAAKYEHSDAANAQTAQLLSLDTHHELQIKHKTQLVGALKLQVQLPTRNELQVNVDVQRQKHTANLNVHLARHKRQHGDYLADIKAQFNKHSLEINAKGDINEQGRYAVDSKLTTSWGSTATLQGQVSEQLSAQDIYIELTGNLQLSAKQAAQQFQIKLLGNSEKTTAEFQLNHAASELVKFNSEWQHPQDKVNTGKANFVLKNLLNSKLDFKVAKNGKGDLNAFVELTKATEPKKLELQAKYHIQPTNKFEIDAILLLNADKETPLLHLKTETSLDKQKFSTANVVEFSKQKIEFNAHANSKGDWQQNGELTADFDFTLPGAQRLEGVGKRKITTNPKTGLISGQMEWSLTQTQNDGKKRTLQANGKLEKFQPNQKLFVNDVGWMYTDTEGKKLDVKLQIKHLPKNQNKQQKTHSLDFFCAIEGDLLPQNAQLKIVSNEYGCQFAHYDATLQYGELMQAQLKGQHDISNYKLNLQPISYDIDLHVKLPKNKELKNYHLKSAGKWQRPNAQQIGQLQHHFSQVFQDSIEFDLNAQGTKNNAKYDVTLTGSKLKAPFKLSGEFQQAEGQLKHKLNAEMGDDYLRSTLDTQYTPTVGLQMSYLIEKSENHALAVKLNTQQHNNDYVVSLDLEHNKKDKYAMEANIYGSNKRGVALYISAPQLSDKLTVLCVSETLGEQQGKLQLELSKLFGLDLQAEAEADLRKIDDFNLLIKWNSQYLKLQDYVLKLQTEQGKKLNFNLKNAQEEIVSGTFTHTKKEEGNKSIIEGQGQLEYRGQKQLGNFRLIKQRYEVSIDKELGVSYSLNGQIGARNGVANLKLTNKEFNVKLSVCEEKKQCSNLQIQSIVALDEQEKLDNLRHSLLVLIDLRELGYPYEFELQSKTQRQGFKAQYSLDTKLISNNNHRYQLIASLASLGSGKIQLKLPKRDIVLDLQQQLPANNAIFGHYEQSLALWLNHDKKPQDVTRFSISGNLMGELGAHAQLNAQAVAKFENPNMRSLSLQASVEGKRAEQSLNAQIVADIFKTPEQQLKLNLQLKNEPNSYNLIITNQLSAPAFDFAYNVKAHNALTGLTDNWKYSSGLELSGKLDKEHEWSAKSVFDLSTQQLRLLLEAWQEPIVSLESDWNKNKLQAKLQIVGQTPVEFLAETQQSAASISLQRANVFDAEAAFKLGKDITVKVNGANNDNFVNGRIALDANNFLQTTYESDLPKLEKHLQDVEHKLQEDSKKAIEKLKERFDNVRDIAKHQKENVEQALPDLSTLKDNFKNSMQEIINELESDPMIKHIAQAGRKLLETIEKFIVKMQNAVQEFCKIAIKSVQDIFENLRDLIENSLLPICKDFLQTFIKIFSQIRAQIVQLHLKLWEALIQSLQKYAPIFKSYGKILHETLRTVTEATQEFQKMANLELKQISAELQELWQQFNAEKWTPMLERLQAQWKHWKLTENVVELLNQVLDHLQDWLQTPESREFLEQLQNYLKYKVQATNAQKTDLEKLLPLSIKALRSVITEIITPSMQNTQLSNFLPSQTVAHSINYLLGETVQLISKLPALFTLRLSLINYLLHESWASWQLADLKQAWFSLSLLTPFELHAHLVNGQQFVSYDGAYADFKGDNCRFILTQDMLDQNFTIVVQQQNVKLRALSLITRDGETLEVTDNGALKLNGAAIEYPLHSADLHAWQLYYTITLRSQYGVEISCLKDLSMCHVTVNGFFAGRLRGLLGNANSETFDDGLLPEGTLPSKQTDVGAAYALGKCNNLVANTEIKPESELCAEMFSWQTTLSAGFLLLDPQPYRQGCSQALALANEAEHESKACEWALAYVSALRLQGALVTLPANCLKCGKNQPIGHELNVKLPGNKADVLLLVDLQASPVVLESLAAPLLSELREALKSRTFTDVQIGVIVYNETQRYPALLSSNAGKLDYHGNLAELNLHDGPLANPCSDCIPQLINNPRVLHIYKLFEGLLSQVIPNAEHQAHRLALKYPFRAQASSTLIVVRSKPLSKSSFLHYLKAQYVEGLPDQEKTIVHLIEPVEKMSVEGIPNEKLLGFNTRLIATLDGKDPKKRSKLQYENDAGVDLILNSGGWVFNTQHLDALKPQDRKKALTQVTNTIADTTFKTEQVTECKCETVYGMFAEHKCTVKSANFVANKKVKSK